MRLTAFGVIVFVVSRPEVVLIFDRVSVKNVGPRVYSDLSWSMRQTIAAFRIALAVERELRLCPDGHVHSSPT